LRRIITLDEERALLDRTPLGRLGRPSDIADVALFLASEESGWINGEVIAATGGLQY
jgi:NAD(P)-dependent dehydrogenase (short-subunit alcohol dehydrogenase family)